MRKFSVKYLNVADYCVAGIDEVGRGALAGPVITAAVILDPKQVISKLMDSKKTTVKQREVLYAEIMAKARCWSVGRAEAGEIDNYNILQATMLAMQRAVLGLDIKPDFVLCDGNRCPELPMPVQSIIKGDSLVDEISAASIIAKVVRDKEMILLGKNYPEYGFSQHKGYPTASHLANLAKFGITSHHRVSFAPVAHIFCNQKNN